MKAKVLVYPGKDHILPPEYQGCNVWTSENGHYLFNSWICSKTDFDGGLQVIKGIEHIFDPYEISEILPDLLEGPFIITTSSIQVIIGAPEINRMTKGGEYLEPATSTYYGQPAEIVSKDLMGYELVPKVIQDIIDACYESLSEKDAGRLKEGIDKLEELNPDHVELVRLRMLYNRLIN